MIRLILFGAFFLWQYNAARESYADQSFGRMPTKNSIISRFARSLPICPTFMQSRHFHADQLARDNRDLSQPPSFAMAMSSSYYYSYGGPGWNLAISSREACRLRDNICSFDYQCCSGKCRCVRWSATGQVSCWKKCF